MTIDELRTECDREGLLLRECSEHHFQIGKEPGIAIVDVWPGTNKYRDHGAAEAVKAISGSARRAVNRALHLAGRKVEQRIAPERVNGNAVDHPAHYNAGSMEVIDAIEGLKLGFHAGNVVKYVARYKHKGGVEDLKKARWYLERLIENEVNEPAF
jgi:hypothetical protein